MQRQSEFKFFSVSLLFNGDSEWQNFRVLEQSWNSLQERLECCEDPADGSLMFINLSASNRSNVLFKRDALMAARFLWDPIRGSMVEPEEPLQNIRIHLLGQKQLIETYPTDTSSAFDFYMHLQESPMGNRQFACFYDEDGEEIAVNPQYVKYVEMPGSVFDEISREVQGYGKEE